MMPNDALLKALEEQEAELKALDAKIAPLLKLQEERDSILHLVNVMRFRLGMDTIPSVERTRRSRGRL